jgi:hypothetical protein
MSNPTPPNGKGEYCLFAAEWIRARAAQSSAERKTSYPEAARAFRRAYPAIALEVRERIGDWPSSEPEFRALQNTR